MTCNICKGTGYYRTVDYTPDGVEVYREVCPRCHPDAPLGVAELVSIEYSDRVESNFMQSLPHPNGGER